LSTPAFQEFYASLEVNKNAEEKTEPHNTVSVPSLKNVLSDGTAIPQRRLLLKQNSHNTLANN
jgi:hypothetical protein